jgi:hypothetical protein
MPFPNWRKDYSGCINDNSEIFWFMTAIWFIGAMVVLLGKDKSE